MATQTLGELLIKIGADVGDVSAKFDAVSKRLDNLVDRADRTGEGFTRFEARTVSLNSALDLASRGLSVIRAGLESVAGFLETAISKSQGEEETFLRLNATLRASRQFTDAYAAGLKGLADRLEAVTGVSSDTVGATETLLVALGAAPREIEPLLRSAITLSRTFDVDLGQAARRLILGVNGNSEALSKFGITVDKTASRTQRLAQIQREVTTSFADPTAVANYGLLVANVSTEFDNLQKAIGRVVTDTPELRALLTVTAQALREVTDVVAANRGSLIEWVGSSIVLAVNGLRQLSVGLQVVIKGVEAFTALTSGPSGLERLFSGESITPIADGLAAANARTRELQDSFVDLTAKVRAEMAASASATGQVSQAAQDAALASGQVGTSLDAGADAARGAVAKYESIFDPISRSADKAKTAVEGVGASANKTGVAAEKVGKDAKAIAGAVAEIPESVSINAELTGDAAAAEGLKVIRDAAGNIRQVISVETPGLDEAGTKLQALKDGSGAVTITAALDDKGARQELDELNKLRAQITIDANVDPTEVENYLSQFLTPQQLAAFQLLADTRLAREEHAKLVEEMQATINKKVDLEINREKAAADLADFARFGGENKKRVELELALNTAEAALQAFVASDAGLKKLINSDLRLDTARATLNRFIDTQDRKVVSLDAVESPAVQAVIDGFLERLPSAHRTALLAELDVASTESALAFFDSIPTTHTTAILADVDQVNAAVAAIPEPIATRTLVIRAVVTGSPELPFSNYWQQYAPTVLDDFVKKANEKAITIPTTVSASLGALDPFPLTTRLGGGATNLPGTAGGVSVPTESPFTFDVFSGIRSRLEEQARLAQEANDINRQQVTETRKIASGLASGGFAADTTKTQQRRAFLGGTFR